MTFTKEDLEKFRTECQTVDQVVKFLDARGIKISTEKAALLLSNLTESNAEELTSDGCCTDGCGTDGCEDFHLTPAPVP